MRRFIEPFVAAVRICHHHALQQKRSHTRLESSALQPSSAANAYLGVPVPGAGRRRIRGNRRSRLDHRIAASKDHGQSRFQTALQQIGLSELESCRNWGEQLLRFSLIANQTEHLVPSSKQLGNQSASENPSGTGDGYSQLATPTFIFTLLILIRRAALHLRLRTNTGDFRHCGARRIVVVLKLQFHPADLKARRTERLSRRPSCQFSG